MMVAEVSASAGAPLSIRRVKEESYRTACITVGYKYGQNPGTVYNFHNLTMNPNPWGPKFIFLFTSSVNVQLVLNNSF